MKKFKNLDNINNNLVSFTASSKQGEDINNMSLKKNNVVLTKSVTKVNDLKIEGLTLNIKNEKNRNKELIIYEPENLGQELNSIFSELVEGCVYSLNITLYSTSIGHKSIGEHLLVTRDSNIDILIEHLENIIENETWYYWNDEEESNDNLSEEANIWVKIKGKLDYLKANFREVEILKGDYTVISKKENFYRRLKEIEYLNKFDHIANNPKEYTSEFLTEEGVKREKEENNSFFQEEEEKSEVNYIKNLVKVLPPSANSKDFGYLMDRNYKYTPKSEENITKLLEKKGIEKFNGNTISGILYKYSPDIKILIYNKKITHNRKHGKYNKQIESYKGIVFKKNKEFFRFEDIIIDLNSNTFSRKIKNQILFYKENKIDYIDKYLYSKPLSQEKRDDKENKNFITFDLEAYLENGNYVPFACAFYGFNIKKKKNEFYYYYARNFLNWTEMMEKALLDIFNIFPNHTVYVHNLGGFDSVYMLKTLCKIGHVTPLFKNNNLISIFCVANILMEQKKKDKVIMKNKKITINFRDSFKILPLSLKKLIKAFGVQTNKLYYPYLFPNKDNLDYDGVVPDYKYFSLLKPEYELYVTQFKEKSWNLLNQTREYIHNDVKSLFEILNIYASITYSTERLNITSSATASSLALKTYISNYYSDYKLNNTFGLNDFLNKNKSDENTFKDEKGAVKNRWKKNYELMNINEGDILIPPYSSYKDLRKAYFGGRVEVFKSYGKNVYIYDVNSLFPYAMKNKMPGGRMFKSTDKNLKNYFGVCYVTVNVPDDMYNPILPYKDNSGNNYNPTGSWSGWYCSELLKYAQELGIQVTVHWGYKFDSLEGLFNNYVDHFYSIKKKSKIDENKGLYQLSKLNLNSLYGRWGLKYHETITTIISFEEAELIKRNKRVIESNVIDFNNKIEYVKYINAPSSTLNDIDPEFYQKELSKYLNNPAPDFLNRSIQISIFTTAYASIYMHKFLSDPNNSVLYTDTDSVFLEKPLNPSFIGEEIGQLKFEGIAKEAFFISPKLYCLLMDNGEVIIKSKGVKKENLTVEDFRDLMKGKTKEVKEEKWKTSWTSYAINVNQMIINISSDLLKRDLITQDKFTSDTKPLKVVKKKLIRTPPLPLNRSITIYQEKKNYIMQRE